MDIVHLPIQPTYKQQVLFISFHFHVLDAPALEKIIRRNIKMEVHEEKCCCNVF